MKNINIVKATRKGSHHKEQAGHSSNLLHGISYYFDKVTIQLHTHPNDREKIERLVSALESDAIIVNRLDRHPNSPENAPDRIQLDLLPHLDKKVLHRVRDALANSPCRLSYSIRYVELAHNFLTKNETDAALIQQFLYKHLYLPRYSASPNWYSDTVYFGDKGSTKLYAIYSDRPCKATGQACCHLELRVNDTAAVKRLDIHTIDDLINFDHGAFWGKQIKLLEFQPRRLGKIHCSQYKLEIDKSRHPRVAGLYLRADVYDAIYHSRNLPIQHLISKIPFPFNRYTREISLQSLFR